MRILYNIYCDESCHLENDGNNIMVLGGISCPSHLKQEFFNDIRNIKEKHNLSPWFEIKWTKVSASKIEFYLELVEYFFSRKDLFFRGIVATNKKKLDHNKYNDGKYDIWYYKMYFRLLAPMIDPFDEYRIFIDIKDTKGGPKVKKLKEVLCNNIYDFKNDVIRDINQINSKESELLQLTDLLIGALTYYHRGIYKEDWSNDGKVKLIDEISRKYNVDLSRTTKRNEGKFNIFIWEPREELKNE